MLLWAHTLRQDLSLTVRRRLPPYTYAARVWQLHPKSPVHLSRLLPRVRSIDRPCTERSIRLRPSRSADPVGIAWEHFRPVHRRDRAALSILLLGILAEHLPLLCRAARDRRAR